MIHVSAVNAYKWYDSNCIVKVTGFLARKGVSFRFAQEKNLLECQVLCQYKNSIQFNLKARKKGLQQPKTRHQRLRKPNAIFVKEARISNSAPAITTFSSYFACIAITNGLKALFRSFLNALKL